MAKRDENGFIQYSSEELARIPSYEERSRVEAWTGRATGATAGTLGGAFVGSAFGPAGFIAGGLAGAALGGAAGATADRPPETLDRPRRR